MFDKLCRRTNMIKELTYNLPGYGFANCYLIGQAVDLMDMFESSDVIKKMQNTCQLGTMKYVYPGAHHTRYEYVFTQLMLISNIASVENVRRNIELSLSSNLKEYESKGYNLSGSALMQCLSILSNAGHMYDTFTADKVILRLLCESRSEKTDFYKIYKRNLPIDIRGEFDRILSIGNYYKLHLFHIVHVLQSACRSNKYKKLCELCICIIEQLIDPNLIKNEATERIFFLYKKVRKIAYLSVDMVYTPASFGANLSRMIYSIASYVDDLFDENSAMNKSIQQLEEIIHQQIYDSAYCILNSARIEQEDYSKYKEALTKITDVFQLRKFLKEDDEFSSLHSNSQPKAIKSIVEKSTLLLAKNWDSDNQNYNLTDEANIALRLPLTRVVYGTQLAQNLRKIYSAYGVISSEYIQKDIQTIIAHTISTNSYSKQNKIDLIKYAIQSIYQFGKYFFNITVPKGFSTDDCIFIGTGSKKIAKEIKRNFNQETVSNPDQLHEIMSTVDWLESFEYSGTVVCFVGGIKASQYNKTEKIDELDGFIYLPNRNLSDGFAYIIEAKNYPNGEKDAVRQLKSTEKYLADNIKTSIITKLKYACMEISLTNEN